MSQPVPDPAVQRSRLPLMLWPAGVVLTIALLAAAAAALVLTIRRRALDEPPPALPCPVAETVASKAPGFLLPDLTGLAGPEAAGPETVALFGSQVPRVTVTVDRSGAVTVGKVAWVAPWRGVDLPVDAGPPIRSENAGDTEELVVSLSASEGKAIITVRNWRTSDLAELSSKWGVLRKLCASPAVQPVVSAKPDVPFGLVAGAVAVLTDAGCEPDFRWAPSGNVLPPAVPALSAGLKALATKFPWSSGSPAPGGLSALGVRIRADSRASWGAVQRAMETCAEAGTWRVAFSCFRDGRELVLGRVRPKDAARSRRPVLARDLPVEPPLDPVPADPPRAEPGEGPAVTDLPLGR